MSYERYAKRIKLRFQKLMTEYRELFYYGSEVDSWLPEVTLLPYVSLMWKGAPTWYRVIAPAGSGKSAHIQMVKDHPKSYSIDEFTTKAFVSGFRGPDGKDPSKLKDMHEKVLVIGDESTIMEMRADERNQLMAMLRQLYDGTYTKGFGNMEGKNSYLSEFNILVASTPMIDRFFQYNQALGERFVNFRLQIPNRLELAERAFYNSDSTFKVKEAKLIEKVHSFIDILPDVNMEQITIPRDIEKRIIYCANFVALVRTHVLRDSKGTTITTLPLPESAGRLTKQLKQTVCASAILHGDVKAKPVHLRRALYFGVGSVIGTIAFIMHRIYTNVLQVNYESEAAWFTPQDMVISTGFGLGTIRHILEDFAVHRILQIKKGKKKGPRGIAYRISPGALSMMQDLQLFKDYEPPFKELFEFMPTKPGQHIFKGERRIRKTVKSRIERKLKM